VKDKTPNPHQKNNLPK